MRVVLDTAAFIAALRSPKGAAAEIIRLLLRREISLLLDYKLASEYRDVGLRREHLAASGLSASEVEQLILSLELVAEPVEVTRRYRPLSGDPDDDMVLDLAIHARTDCIITHNIRHLRGPAEQFGIPVMTPGEFLGFLREH